MEITIIKIKKNEIIYFARIKSRKDKIVVITAWNRVFPNTFIKKEFNLEKWIGYKGSDKKL